MQQISTLFAVKTRTPNSERSYWIQQIADLTGIPFKKILWKFNHLVGSEGTEIIRHLYEDALTEDTAKGRAIRVWVELKKTVIK